MKLHNYWRSSSSWRVRAALAYKGIDYEYVAVDMSAARAPRGLPASAPLGQVPVLEWPRHGEVTTVTQSVAIIELLEELVPDPALYPGDTASRTEVRELVEMINAGTQPLQNSGLLRALDSAGVDGFEFARAAIARGLGAVEARLPRTAGRFAVGDQLTAADLFIVPQLYNARRFAVGLAGFPRTLAVERVAAAHPALVAGHPDRQPDAPQ